MRAVVTHGVGGFEQLTYTEVVMPEPNTGEVVVKVLAAGVNNTDINTRLGWYSSSVTVSTEEANVDDLPDHRLEGAKGWNSNTSFPLIQGTDCCGLIVALGKTVDQVLLNRRVLIRPCIRKTTFLYWSTLWMGSDFDGAFAEYVNVPATEVFPLNSHWTDAELATIPCSYATAENMLERANLKEGETVLITGASGGVGSAAIQLATRRGASVIAVGSEKKLAKIGVLDVGQIYDRSVDLIATMGERHVDLVVDNVGGSRFPDLIKLLKNGGRYVSSGAIAGPIVEFDMRDMYLKDISLIGSTAWDEQIFPNLIRYIENHEIIPLLAKTFPLESIVQAQKEFMLKQHVGNFVLIP